MKIANDLIKRINMKIKIWSMILELSMEFPNISHSIIEEIKKWHQYML